MSGLTPARCICLPSADHTMSRGLQENGLVGVDAGRYSAVGFVEVGAADVRTVRRMACRLG